MRETEVEPGKGAAWCAIMLGKLGYNLDDRRQIVWRRIASDVVSSAVKTCTVNRGN